MRKGGRRFTSAAKAASLDGFTARLKPCPYKNAGAKSRRFAKGDDSARPRTNGETQKQVPRRPSPEDARASLGMTVLLGAAEHTWEKPHAQKASVGHPAKNAPIEDIGASDLALRKPKATARSFAAQKASGSG